MEKQTSDSPVILRRRLGRWVALSTLVVLGGIGILLRFGGYILVANDALPQHAQVAVVLGGSSKAEVARREEAMRLLRRGVSDEVMLSVPKVGYWGQPLPEIARRYLETTYGPAEAKRVAFCEMPESVDSTEDEARVLQSCLENRGWRSVLIVTSNYHTRRARLVWRRTLEKAVPPVGLTVWGVSDGSFEPNSWWRRRIYAKTWVLEVSKLLWTSLFDPEP